MITIKDIQNSPEIEKLLASDQYSADVYALHTGDEALCSAYFVELKPEFPDTALEKYLALWKAYSLNTYHEAGDETKPAGVLPKLMEEFGYVQQYFAPVKFEDSHQTRINHILDDVESLIASNEQSVNSAANMPIKPGVYLNGERSNIDAIKAIREKLNACSDGIVPLNEWSEFDALLVRDKKMYFFTWATYA